MSGTYYITQVYLGYWPITRPKRTVDKSLIGALGEPGMPSTDGGEGGNAPSSGFRSWMFREYGWELIDEAREYIGVTTEVTLVGQKPREFREGLLHPEARGREMAFSDRR